ncbi:MAG: hypothetical protein H6719_37825, partial [Sandaracinaceae bacterium]|nr:hypothetical protein [Sandaracinaceae bacterium]
SRRVGFLDDGSAFAIYFGPGVKRWRPPLGPIETLEAPELRDAATARDGSRAVLLADDGTILELRARGAARTLSRVDGARAVATFADGRVLVGGHDLAVLDDGQTEGVASLPRAADVLDVALSPDERFTATALADGGILVHRVATWALAAELREHGDRVSALTFEGDATLVSASWDGTIRRWDLDALDADAARMATELEEQWGLQLREVLSAP